ncbi:uncharacterized protein (DUF885 family) [Caulobacter ginsengisoli]|uniref:Uncharacterized protein (DUF885 family) n=1 Tax=Caulobacter ginsengisoli TaxID=400775 RepID=A0ABU0IQV0_9CAUL|nr:DUF885 family protein [Caulobacter ginsengisoli]MDQ0464391.1 uncharacterized protein (DUF885 family) [Caulobacter ginsengisoli]
MIRSRLILAGLAAAFMMSGPGVAEQSSFSPWDSLSADYVAFTHEQDPIRAGARGDAEALRRWPDNSPANLARQAKTLKGFQARLAAIPTEGLSETDALSKAMMARQAAVSLESIALDEARLAFRNGEGFYTTPDGVAQATTLSDEAEAQAWLARMAGVSAYFERETANLQRGIDTRFTQPTLVTQRAIEVVEKAAALPAEQSPLLIPLATLPDSLPAARRAELRAQALKIIETSVKPAQRRLAVFLRERYLPASRPALGVSTLPGGPAYYAFVVRRETTTDLTPQQIHDLGLKEVARIRARMQEVMDEVGFKGDVRAFSDSLRADPANFAPNAQVYAEKLGELAKRVDYLLPRYFGTLPRLTYGVRAKPAALESTSDGYLVGSPESGQAGQVVYAASGATREPLYNMPAWFLHEGVPGHHLQIALAQENTGLPEYRRNDDITAYVEGWALYAERLGEDLGVYRTPQEKFGRLSMEMWRACRLVIDTGLHAMGWSRDQAAACLKDNTAMTNEAIYGEVDRYIGWPAQALGYKIGELRIEAMRAEAEEALGSRFDIRAFHDVVLGAGALPMDLLEKRVDVWIAEKKAAR